MDKSGVGAEGVHNQITGTVLGPSVQAVVIHGGVHVHPVPIPTVVPRQLPGAIPNFVGRIHELDILTAQVDRATESGGTVVITSIGGTAGIGKTTLAIYWGRQVLDWFPDGQLYVDLRGFAPGGTPMTPPEAVRGFLDAFQVPVEKIPTDLDAQAALYRSLVQDKHMLIVLDNARDTDQVRPLLPGSPTCLVVVTSRQQLASLIAREQAKHTTLDFLTLGEARELLTKFLGTERILAEADAVDELDALGHHRQALTLCEELGDRTGQAHTHHALSWTCERQGHYTEALTHAQHALAVLDQLDHPDAEQVRATLADLDRTGRD